MCEVIKSSTSCWRLVNLVIDIHLSFYTGVLVYSLHKKHCLSPVLCVF